MKKTALAVAIAATFSVQAEEFKLPFGLEFGMTKREMINTGIVFDGCRVDNCAILHNKAKKQITGFEFKDGKFYSFMTTIDSLDDLYESAVEDRKFGEVHKYYDTCSKLSDDPVLYYIPSLEVIMINGTDETFGQLTAIMKDTPLTHKDPECFELLGIIK